MCSVSFLPRDGGYVLAMNRDELLTRSPGLPPKILSMGKIRVLCPREPGGGTWVGINSVGLALSLINWHSEPNCASPDPVSRGEVVRALLAARNYESAYRLLEKLPLKGINPFRLILVSLSEGLLFEWRSSRGTLERIPHPWQRHHWFSSGLDEAKANQVRHEVFGRISEEWNKPLLRKLHSDHAPKAGPFSVCMHRKDACTVSYTELDVSTSIASMLYIAGSPCSPSPRYRAALRLAGVTPAKNTLAQKVSETARATRAAV